MPEGLVLPGGMQVGTPSTEQLLMAILENVQMTRIFTELQFRCKNGQTRDEALRVLGLSIRDFPKRGEVRPKVDDPQLKALNDEAIARAQADARLRVEAAEATEEELTDAAREDGDLALD